MWIWEFLKSLFILLWYDEDDDLDFDWIATSKEESELQQAEEREWHERQNKKGRTT